MFAFNHAVGQRKPRTFWSARREPARGEQALGTDLYLSFLDLDFNPSVPDERTLYARMLCTNGHLASRLPSGAQLQWEGGLPLQEVRLLKAPTPQRDPPLGGAPSGSSSRWCPSATSRITELPNGVEVLREMIRRHGREGDEALDDQLQGLLKLESREFVHPMTAADGWRGFCRGLELVLTVDESLFVGGSALLLSAVLNHFFGLQRAGEHPGPADARGAQPAHRKDGEEEAMATHVRRDARSVNQRLREEAHRFDFYQAVRLLKTDLRREEDTAEGRRGSRDTRTASTSPRPCAG